MAISHSPTEHPEYQEWLQVTPRLFLHCRFNPLYKVLDGYREEPLSAAETNNLARYRAHCQQSLKTLYDTLGTLPADQLPIRTRATTFTIQSRAYAVYGDVTVLQLKYDGSDVLQPLPDPISIP
ncbi:hypothetical protein LJY25_03620 [Hymenobacter sp. BT175]|uniref:hypothetical protein n=1 Tax=Hymenobacter translucens TaxID=2886507 RepID=UPI001D0F27D7|nr:hypothetical protein [Hymenobacter translucens]MCC2545520.1 hypothetical protein [Hymenobacter translucens]